MITAASAGLTNRISTFTHGVRIDAFTQGFPNMAGAIGQASVVQKVLSP